MSTGADIAVVGAGYVGLACAIELAQRGASVVLIERELPGAANSLAAPGGIRQQFGTPLNIQLAQLSAPTWDTFADRFGVDLAFRRSGYLFLARSSDQLTRLAASVAMQQAHGVSSETLTADEVSQRWPILASRDFLGGSFRAEDGWANQYRIVHGLTLAALRSGVQLEG